MKTVSRVLNREPNVREDTRERVLAAVAQLRYVPHSSARSLAGNKSYLIALLYNNPSRNYLMEVMTGVLAACEEHQYNMLLCPLELDDPTIVDGVETLVARLRPDGLLLTPPITDSPALLARMEEIGVPSASISPKDGARCSGASMDETRAAAEMVAHLASLGHRRIAHIAGHPAHGASDWRLAGYRAGLEQAGIRYDAALVQPGEFTFESGRRGVAALLDLPRAPTAIFAGNDDMAAGAIAALLERGLHVPQDVSVCGFDDSPVSKHIFPALTTVHQPAHDMGRLATLELLSTIRTRRPGRMLHVPFTLRLRDSTGPAPR
jgi:LacI family transcriptional regulator